MSRGVGHGLRAKGLESTGFLFEVQRGQQTATHCNTLQHTVFSSEANGIWVSEFRIQVSGFRIQKIVFQFDKVVQV